MGVSFVFSLSVISFLASFFRIIDSFFNPKFYVKIQPTRLVVN